MNWCCMNVMFLDVVKENKDNANKLFFHLIILLRGETFLRVS